MALYEHVFLARQDLSAQQVEALVEQYKGVIESLGGSVGRVENWGLKSLTYRINKNRKAHYTLMDITAPAAALHEMERQMGLSEDVLRFMTIRVEEAGNVEEALKVAYAVAHSPLAANPGLKWTYETGGSIESTAAIVGSRVYIGTMTGAVLAIDLNSGRLRWKFTTGGNAVSAIVAGATENGGRT